MVLGPGFLEKDGKGLFLFWKEKERKKKWGEMERKGRTIICEVKTNKIRENKQTNRQTKQTDKQIKQTNKQNNKTNKTMLEING